MLLNVKEMEVRALPFAIVWKPGEFDMGDSGVRQNGPLSADGLAELLPNTGGEIRVKGKVKAELESECDRCLGRASFSIDEPFDLFYRRADSVSAEDGEEIAIDAGEAEMGFYEPPGLQLEDILREYLLLQLPMQRVCDENCRGICPICGANRNDTECHCQARPTDDRWMPLKKIHI